MHEKATAAKLDYLLGAFTYMKQQLEKSRGRESAILEIHPVGAAVHPQGETGGQGTPPSSPASSSNARRGREDLSFRG